MYGKNPYGTATEAYGATAGATDQRSLEGKALLKSAFQLEQLQKELASGNKVPLEYIGDTMEYNQKLWNLFVNEAMNPENPLPDAIKGNIASLGIFVFKRTRDVLIDTQPEKIQALIDINRNIASGLMKRTEAPADEKQRNKAPQSGATDSVA